MAWRQTAFTVEVNVPTCRAIARADMPVGSRLRIWCFFAALIGRQVAFRMPRAVVVSLAAAVGAMLAVLGSGATSPAMRRLRKASRGSQLFELMLPRCTGPPCGACREMMTQLMPSRFGAIEVMIDYAAGKTMTLADLTPQWWLRR